MRLLGVLFAGVASVMSCNANATQLVRASFYGGGEYLNKHTSNGEVFNARALTAAHRTLPIGTRVRVTYKGKSCVVRINDRGPAAWTGRSLDLSRGAAGRIGLIRAGIGAVTLEVMR